MCSYFRVYISSPSYHWWWSCFHGDTRYSWSGAWVHVLTSNTLAQTGNREGECDGGNVVGGRCAPFLGTEICFWAELSFLPHHQLAVRPSVLDPGHPARDPAYTFQTLEEQTKLRFTLGLKLFCFHSLTQGQPNNVITIHKVSLFLQSSDVAQQLLLVISTKL